MEFDFLDDDLNMMPRFWMVYGINQGVPTVMHHSRDLAEKEARRLSMANRGKAFVVLEVVDAYFMPPQGPHKIKITEPDGRLPF